MDILPCSREYSPLSADQCTSQNCTAAVLSSCSFGHQPTCNRLYICTRGRGPGGLDSIQLLLVSPRYRIPHIGQLDVYPSLCALRSLPGPWLNCLQQDFRNQTNCAALQVCWRAWFCPNLGVGYRVRWCCSLYHVELLLVSPRSLPGPGLNCFPPTTAQWYLKIWQLQFRSTSEHCNILFVCLSQLRCGMHSVTRTLKCENLDSSDVYE